MEHRATCCPPNGFDVRPDGSRPLIAAVLINSAAAISAGSGLCSSTLLPDYPKRALLHAALIMPYRDQWGGYR